MILFQRRYHVIAFDALFDGRLTDGCFLVKLITRDEVDRKGDGHVLRLRLVHQLLNNLRAFLVEQRLADLKCVTSKPFKTWRPTRKSSENLTSKSCRAVSTEPADSRSQVQTVQVPPPPEFWLQKFLRRHSYQIYYIKRALLCTLCPKKTTLMLHTIDSTHINRFR